MLPGDKATLLGSGCFDLEKATISTGSRILKGFETCTACLHVLPHGHSFHSRHEVGGPETEGLLCREMGDRLTSAGFQRLRARGLAQNTAVRTLFAARENLTDFITIFATADPGELTDFLSLLFETLSIIVDGSYLNFGHQLRIDCYGLKKTEVGSEINVFPLKQEVLQAGHGSDISQEFNPSLPLIPIETEVGLWKPARDQLNQNRQPHDNGIVNVENQPPVHETVSTENQSPRSFAEQPTPLAADQSSLGNNSPEDVIESHSEGHPLNDVDNQPQVRRSTRARTIPHRLQDYLWIMWLGNSMIADQVMLSFEPASPAIFLAADHRRIATLLIFSGWFVRTPFQGYFSEQKRPLSIATPEVTCSFADNGACTLAKRTAQGHRQMNTSIPVDRLFVEVQRRETGLEQLTAIRPETAGEDVMGAPIRGSGLYILYITLIKNSDNFPWNSERGLSPDFSFKFRILSSYSAIRFIFHILTSTARCFIRFRQSDR
nr:hypothetical protein Iba_chr10bCG10600 [Ipomoea batatas]